MGLREALVSFEEGENMEEFMRRAFQAARDAGGSGRLRLETGWAMSLSPGGALSAGVSLWVERGQGTSESWQRVTGIMLGDSYEEVLQAWGQAFDEHRSIRQEA